MAPPEHATKTTFECLETFLYEKTGRFPCVKKAVSHSQIRVCETAFLLFFDFRPERLFTRFCLFEHHSRVADAALAFARRAANHAGNFLRALLFVKARHLGARRSVFVVFADQILRIRHRGNLPQIT